MLRQVHRVRSRYARLNVPCGKAKIRPNLVEFLFERKKPGPLGEVRARGSAIKDNIEFISLRLVPFWGTASRKHSTLVQDSLLPCQ